MASDQKPFEPKSDTAYMEVPVCRACVKWDVMVGAPKWGYCNQSSDPLDGLIETSGAPFVTSARFGCVEFESK